MDPNDTTINTETVMDSSPMDSSPDRSHEPEPSAETINTDTGEETTEAAEEVQAKEAEAKAKETEELDRFDKHPRFQKLLKENSEFKNQTKEFNRQIAELQKQLSHMQTPTKQRDYDAEINGLDEKLASGDLELSDYNKQVRKIEREKADAEWSLRLNEMEQKGRAQEYQAQFIKDYPYVDEFLKTRQDEISSIRGTNPIHDDLTAAIALKVQDLEAGQQQAIDDAVAKATKETEARVRKDYEAKRTARSLGSGPATTPNQDDELKNTKAHGGAVQAIAARLARSRKTA